MISIYIIIGIITLIALVMAGVIGINTRNIEHLHDQQNAIATSQSLLRKEVEVLKGSNSGCSADIDEIISKLEIITENIKRLDERTEADHRDLVDIRMRYVNYRMPVIEENSPFSPTELDTVHKSLRNFEEMRDA